MKEIKFRVWDKDDKKMFSLGEALKDELISIDYGDCYLRAEYINVFLMQYTGLKDKNEKEIYEGDVVECVEMHDSNVDENWHDGNPTKIIKWDEKNAMYIYPYDLSYWEVIGNVYQNPELLNERNNKKCKCKCHIRKSTINGKPSKSVYCSECVTKHLLHL